MNLSPRQRFLKTPEAKAHSDLVDSPSFQHALEVALSEMQLAPPKGTDAQANWNRLEGAKQFITILLNLAEPPVPAKRRIDSESLIPTR